MAYGDKILNLRRLVIANQNGHTMYGGLYFDGRIILVKERTGDGVFNTIYFDDIKEFNFWIRTINIKRVTELMKPVKVIWIDKKNQYFDCEVEKFNKRIKID